MNTIYQFTIEGLRGSTIDFAAFEGKKILIVNVASECGYTPQYKQLQELYEEMGDKIVVIGFPCNQFGAQEPGSNEKIQSFCDINYGVSFPLSTKIDVKGTNAHPIYKWLTQKSLNGVSDSEVSWNFNKYLLDEKGALVRHFPSATSPFEVLEAI